MSALGTLRLISTCWARCQDIALMFASHGIDADQNTAVCEAHRARRRADRVGRADGSYWHLADNPTAPAFVCYWTKADKAQFWTAMVCPLMTQSPRTRDPMLNRALSCTFRIFFGGGSDTVSSNTDLMSECSDRNLWYCVTTAFASFSVASLH